MDTWKLVVAVLVVVALGTATFLYVAFGAFLPWREEAEAGRLAELAQVRAGQVVADIGAGSGRFSTALARRVGPAGRVYASDVSPARLADLKQRAEGLRNLTVIEATRTETGLPDGCCDLVMMRSVYHHVSDPALFVSALRRVLAPGGRLVIIDFEPGALWFHGGAPSDAGERRPGHGVSQAVVAQEFAAAGFNVEREIAHWSGPLWMTVFRLERVR